MPGGWGEVRAALPLHVGYQEPVERHQQVAEGVEQQAELSRTKTYHMNEVHKRVCPKIIQFIIIQNLIGSVSRYMQESRCRLQLGVSQLPTRVTAFSIRTSPISA